MHRLRALLRKELRQMGRDPRTLVLSLAVPLVLLLLFGYAISFDVRRIRLAVDDRDGSAAGRELIRAFVASDYFRLVAPVSGPDAAARALDRGTASAVLVLPHDLGRDLARGVPVDVQLLVDGADSSRASIVQGHARQVVQGFTARVVSERLRRAGVGAGRDLLPIELRPRVLYNPELSSRNFMVPGLIGVLLTILGVLQTSLAIAREKDRGTLDQLRVTPLRAREILAGKLLPYGLVAFVNAWIALGVGHFLMGVPVRGSLLVFLAGTLLFLAVSLGIGLTISALTATQQGAQTAAFMGTLLPVFYLSDFMFPVRSMPAVLRALSALIPARHYLTILRGTLQKGVGPAEMSGAFTALALYAVVVGLAGVLAVRRSFR